MSLSRADETSVLSKDQLALVQKTHHPAIYETDARELRDLRVKLREERNKLKSLVRQRQRETRGKSEPRGKSFPGDTEQPLKRKQALASALKRINKELERQRKIEVREEHVDAARRALALRRMANFEAPPSDETAGKGMQPVPSTRRRRIIPGSQVGSVSQQTKNAQARKDNRT